MKQQKKTNLPIQQSEKHWKSKQEQINSMDKKQVEG